MDKTCLAVRVATSVIVRGWLQISLRVCGVAFPFNMVFFPEPGPTQDAAMICTASVSRFSAEVAAPALPRTHTYSLAHL